MWAGPGAQGAGTSEGGVMSEERGLGEPWIGRRRDYTLPVELGGKKAGPGERGGSGEGAGTVVAVVPGCWTLGCGGLGYWGFWSDGKRG